MKAQSISNRCSDTNIQIDSIIWLAGCHLGPKALKASSKYIEVQLGLITGSDEPNYTLRVKYLRLIVHVYNKVSYSRLNL